MAEQTPQQLYRSLLAAELVRRFNERNIEAVYCPTKADALQAALDSLTQPGTISCGGSATLYEIGLREALATGGYDFVDPNAPGQALQAAGAALSADYYFMSSNALTESGELVNIDGIGNRVAALSFGPQRVIVIVGLNKVEPTLEAAIQRAKRQAARMIMLKFKPDYADFASLEQAAAQAGHHLLVTSGSALPGRIKVILVGEDVGY